jgi:hypothetical protein
VTAKGARAVGLDFAAVLAFASALGADRGLVAACLPAVELAILKQGDESEGEEDGG